MVAAWISAETGVGPSIASGNQVWRPSCADLPIAPINSKMQVTVSAGQEWPRKVMLVFAMFVLTVAAAEAAIGLAILVVYFRNRGTIAVEDVNLMKG